MFSAHSGTDAGTGPSSSAAAAHARETSGDVNGKGRQQIFTPLDERRELESLTIQDMLESNADLMGISAGMGGLDINASKKTVNASSISAAQLSLLESEMNNLPAARTASYRRALLECPGEVADSRKAVFLEFEDGKEALAAQRLAKYWECRLETFGPELCFLPMTLLGAMKDEALPMAQFRICQLMPFTDAAGRAIIYQCSRRRNLAEYTVQQELRAMFYLLEVITQDKNLRQRGLVIIVDGRYHWSQHSSEAQKRVTTYMYAFPLKVRGVHLLHPSPVLYHILWPVIRYVVGREVRLRQRLHRGSEEEILQELQKYALPRDVLPASIGGAVNFDLAYINQWMMRRRMLEADPLQQRSCGTSIENSEEIGPDVLESRKEEGAKKGSGWRSDARMERAIQTKIANPNLSLLDALREGGFKYSGSSNKEKDAEGVSLRQRKNNLCRRIRLLKKKDEMKKEPAKADSTCKVDLPSGEMFLEEKPRSSEENGNSSDEDSFYDTIAQLPGLNDT